MINEAGDKKTRIKINSEENRQQQKTRDNNL